MSHFHHPAWRTRIFQAKNKAKRGKRAFEKYYSSTLTTLQLSGQLKVGFYCALFFFLLPVGF